MNAKIGMQSAVPCLVCQPASIKQLVSTLSEGEAGGNIKSRVGIHSYSKDN